MGFADFVKTVAPFVPVVGPAIGAVVGLIGSRQTNSAQDARQLQAQDFNSAEAAVNRDWSAKEAAIGRDWTERMSNTAYQRAMGDMRTAGLNPILAYSQGGASSTAAAVGQSSAASSPAPQPVRNALGESFTSAMQAANLGAMMAQIDKTQAEADLTRTQEKHLKTDFTEGVERGAAGDALAGSFSARERDRRASLLHHEVRLAIERAYLTDEQRLLVKQEIKNAIEEERRIRADTRSKQANAVLTELEHAEARNRSRFHESNPNWSENVHWLKGISEILNSAGKARTLGR